jgi:hypothetical protein
MMSDDIVIPVRMTIPPIPLHWISADTESVHGLPEGLIYDTKTQSIMGKPLKSGHYTVLFATLKESGYRYKIVTFHCIKPHTKTHKPPIIGDQLVVLGQPINPIDLTTEQDLRIDVQNLPAGVLYDSFLNQIRGCPEIPVSQCVVVRLIDRYGTETISHFTITVKGVIEPAMKGYVTVVDTSKKVHEIGDIIEYTFVITNTGNVPLFNLHITDGLIGPYLSYGKVTSGQQIMIKCTHRLTKKNLKSSLLSLDAVISAYTTDGFKVTIGNLTHQIKIRAQKN